MLIAALEPEAADYDGEPLKQAMRCFRRRRRVRCRTHAKDHKSPRHLPEGLRSASQKLTGRNLSLRFEAGFLKILARPCRASDRPPMPL